MRTVKILELRFWGGMALLFLLFLPTTAFTQKGDAVNIIEFKYGYTIPFADMASRFGSSNTIGFAAESVKLKSKIFFGFDFMYMFGNEVKEDVIANLRSYDGSVIDVNGGPGDITLKERGYYFGLNAGKIFPTTKHENKLTGIRTQIGIGYLQHKVRVQDNGRSVVALESKYLTGYDRLSSGPALHLGVGYHYQHPKQNFHFSIMADLYGAQTQFRRDLDFATGQKLTEKRTDILGGFSIAYIVVISRERKSGEIYY
jgi:hypothetical protein